MMNDNEYYAKCWKYAVTGFVLIIMGFIGSCQTSNYHIRKAIEAGATPIAARCALTEADRPTCAVIAAAEANGL